MATIREGRRVLPSKDVGLKRKHGGLGGAMEECKENIGPQANSFKRPRLREQLMRVKATRGGINQ